VTLKVFWTLVCTQGLGRCTAKGGVKGPVGGVTTMFLAAATGGSGGGGVKQGRPLGSLVFSCTGPCGGTSHGWFYVQWLTKSRLASRMINFTFGTHCSGQNQTQTIRLLFGSGGLFESKGSSLGEGRFG